MELKSERIEKFEETNSMINDIRGKNIFFVVMCSAVLFFALGIKKTNAEIKSNWHLYEKTAALLSSTQPENPRSGRTTGVFVAYEKSFLRCRPTVSLMSFDGLNLGQVTIPQKYASKSARNRMSVNVNGVLFSAEGETVINEYRNGTEVVAMFDDGLIKALRYPSFIEISIGGGTPVFEVRSLNSITSHAKKLENLCNR
jgi:hypothetical protein